MKIELKQFQESAARSIRDHIEVSWYDCRHNHVQAIVLSSPTGSGKTTTITALMEWIYRGYDNYPADPRAVFLWLSDSPETNQQSRDKILRQSEVFLSHDLVVIESPFCRERLEPGKVYFLNTQKLSKDTLLTKRGDGRPFTIWETIQNTSESSFEHFYVILDEAHRGMNLNPRETEQANSIMQRFIMGYPEGGLKPLQLIIGMSATPQRFQRLVTGVGRVVRNVEISPQDVKASGLLKDKIVLYYPDEEQPADWSLLERSVVHWLKFCTEWRDYCVSQEMEKIVEPILVIQVESGTEDIITRTDLAQLVNVIERVAGQLPNGAWAHSFQEDNDIDAGGQRIRKIDASRIDQDPLVKIVIFKMSLSTGWDCPRAEVMMSFRRAQDETYIAQLVGRMVRTPLARSIESNDFLNTVSLFLPHYDSAGLQAILNKLNNPEPDTGIAVDTETGEGLVFLEKNPAMGLLFEKLSTLKTYNVERMGKLAPVPRLMTLARQITDHDEINLNIHSLVKNLIIDTLENELERLNQSPDFIGNVAENQEIVIKEMWVEYGDWRPIDTPHSERIQATQENIDDLFRQCDRLLGNEGLHIEFWRRRRDVNNPYKAKLELYGLLRDGQTWNHLKQVCQAKINELFITFDADIRRLTSSRQEVYNKIRRSGREPEPETLFISPNITLRKGQFRWDHHLYIEPDGGFWTDLNTWESAVVNEEKRKAEFSGWLRNIPRKSWSLCIPYKLGDDWKPLYPDLLIFKQEGGIIKVDILDPHDSSLADSIAKAKGLIAYARKHGNDFDKIRIYIQDQDEIPRLHHLDLKNEVIQSRILDMQDTDTGQLTELFGELG